ncbi:MAG: AsnC family transcriptional regulator [Euryarchaeota archaeon]|nr:AsnC family transcriptional regulator [Euryarchaeota archaeon]|tara:strand:+ start:420 stop:677 length:258 start_codon:yes stop_codon:yes gene_type:complete
MSAAGEGAVALVLVTTDPGEEARVMGEVKAVEGVQECLLLFGEYDLFMRIEAYSYAQVSAIVLQNIRTIEGVQTTKTLTTAPSLD